MMSDPRNRGLSTKDWVADASPPSSRWAMIVLFTASMVAVPWPLIWQRVYGAPLEDRRVYELQVANGFLSFDVNTFDSLLSYVTGEYLWGWTLDLLIRSLGLPTGTAFGIISAFIVFTAASVVAKLVPAIYVMFLFNPLLIDLAFSQMRIGLAIALASWAYLLRGNSFPLWMVRLLLLAAASIIHTSAIIFICLFALCLLVTHGSLSSRRLLSFAVLTTLGGITALLLGTWRIGILTLLGDRRVVTVYGHSSLKYYVIWLILLAALTFDWPLTTPSATKSYSLAILVAALVGIVSGAYPNRVVTVSLPFLVASIGSLSHQWRGYVVLAYVGYDTLYWFYWLRFMG